MTDEPPNGHNFVELGVDECIALLASTDVGRLCVIDHGHPVAYPVNYRVVPDGRGNVALVLRTRADSMLDQPDTPAGFEIDSVDSLTETGWSVVLRGTLLRADGPTVPFWVRAWDPRPRLAGRDTWLYFVSTAISGRRLMDGVPEWAFSVHGYI
ncbi:unannotated protein [freshwater metagenome]|uniref:Unannotated protein n=1 Tax=freshwater metagenome TaxID=449393 RepID=A0A6J7EVI8_9ZZZZ|nr:hypothetical protein [Actinomycetota bacterium]